MSDNAWAKPVIPGGQAEALLRELAGWGKLTTIVLHGGCVFEFKGPFPEGSIGEGYYNLDGPVPGFHGHIRLDAIDHIAFQVRAHRGRQSYALNFQNSDDENLFKVFLGRDDEGNVLAHQLKAFEKLQQQWA
jgi:hypothetical protein